MEQITQNNKLLAGFLGYNVLSGLKIISVIKNDQLKVFNPNIDWNWLMEVVRECYSKEHHENNYYETIYYALASLDIEAVYNACIEFVKWYNEISAKEN